MHPTVPDTVTSPPHIPNIPRGIDPSELTDNIRHVIRNEMMNVFDEHDRIEQERSKATMARKWLVYGGIAVASTAVTIATTLVAQKLRRKVVPVSVPMPMPHK